MIQVCVERKRRISPWREFGPNNSLSSLRRAVPYFEKVLLHVAKTSSLSVAYS